jgi:hypothetical protein
MIDPRIMARDLKAAHGLHHFVDGLVENRQHDVLNQVYGDLMMHGAEVVRTQAQWNNIPELMGWNAPNFCR